MTGRGRVAGSRPGDGPGRHAVISRETVEKEQGQPLTATAAASRCHQRPATAHDSRAIRANWGYVRP
jgi:hypothetical protein